MDGRSWETSQAKHRPPHLCSWRDRGRVTEARRDRAWAASVLPAVAAATRACEAEAEAREKGLVGDGAGAAGAGLSRLLPPGSLARRFHTHRCHCLFPFTASSATHRGPTAGCGEGKLSRGTGAVPSDLVTTPTEASAFELRGLKLPQFCWDYLKDMNTLLFIINSKDRGSLVTWFSCSAYRTLPTIDHRSRE